ncbi:GvpL/GvpF family gas vesicle protein [Luteipulveratus sp. YIM 133132]|uniref:GvpL/GvpF family gas vesicle protein n=1 Tax=Luteipulveratus flavus TaxID=3031728 RepID=UPI0023AF96E2|nr:GvpL/GvpF family gas vesicle protein [Luteipulveratus sp. YIM 133132]MDE9366918.1 GvpL/GvpF family gas vesicle protein [Luteipulveratus sp. YIM 133132]
MTATAPTRTRELCVYGVVRSDANPDDYQGISGISGEPLELVAVDEIAALVEPVEDPATLGTRDGLMAYRRVLDEAARHGEVLPFRVGSVVPGDDDLVALLSDDHDVYADRLDEIAGQVQLLLRGSYRPEVALGGIVARNPEIRELRELTREAPEEAFRTERIRLGELVSRALDEERAVDRDRVVEALTPYATESVLRPEIGLHGLVNVALLVDRDQVEQLESAAEDLAAELQDRAELQLVGPMAAYDFAATA